VCHKGMIVGEKGVALDDLVYTCTKLMRQMDVDGMDAMIAAADTLSQAVSDTKPLVDATTKLIDQVRCVGLQRGSQQETLAACMHASQCCWRLLCPRMAAPRHPRASTQRLCTHGGTWRRRDGQHAYARRCAQTGRRGAAESLCRASCLRLMRAAVQVHPLLRELRDAGLVDHVDSLATLARETAGDIRKLQTSVLDEDNVAELKRAIKTLTSTLRNIESITGDVAGLSGDSSAHASLRQLIEAFSRLVAD
jgi:hypothetical protein